MHPYLFQGQIGSVPVSFPTFTLFILGALTISILTFVGLCRDVRTKPAAFTIFLCTVFLAAALGAKGGQFLIELFDPVNSGRPWYLTALTSGSTVTTGLLSALAVIFFYALKDFHRILTWPVLDSLAIAVCFGHAVGRMGCFFNGCCFGDLCHSDFPFAITYPDNWIALFLDPGLAQGPRYPAPLIEAGGLIILGISLLVIFRLTRSRGQIVPLYLMGYGILRFAQEFLRGDTIRGSFQGFSTGQWFSAIIFILGILLVLRYAISYSQGKAQAPFLTIRGRKPSEIDAFSTKEIL